MKKLNLTVLAAVLLIVFTLTIFSQTAYRAGDKVEVYYQGVWYKAEIIRIENGKYRIHYDGYDASWDETVEGSRVRSRENQNGENSGKQSQNNAANGFSKGERVSAAYGTVTEIYSGYTPLMYEATIIETGNGRYKVHYEAEDFPDGWQEAKWIKPFDAGDTASIPAGKYVCYMPVYENTYMGSFVVKAGNIYEYLTGNKGNGKFSYNAANRTITWTSGDLAGKNATGEFTNDKQNGPIITVIFNNEKRKGNIQRCLLKN